MVGFLGCGGLEGFLEGGKRGKKNTDLERKKNHPEFFGTKHWGKIHNLSLYYQEIQAV